MQLKQFAKAAGVIGCLAGAALRLTTGAVSAQEQPDALEGHYFYWNQNGGKGLQTFNGTEEETIIEPVVVFNLNLGKRWGINAKFDVDTISNASSSAPEIYATSGASGHDTRHEHNLTVTYIPTHNLAGDRTFLRGGFFQSREYGYKSNGFNFGATQEFLDRNLVLSAAFSSLEDRLQTYRITEEATSGLKEKKTTNWALSITQLLTRKSLVNVTLQLTQQEGYIARSLNSVPIRAGPRQQERLPERRDRIALRTQYNQFFGEHSAFHLIYRYYQDSFEVQAHTFQGRLFHELSDDWEIGGQLRFHTQTAVKYWGESFQGKEDFLTSDSDLGALNSLYTGLDVSWKPMPLSFSLFSWFVEADTRINLLLGHYNRSDGLQGMSTGMSVIAHF